MIKKILALLLAALMLLSFAACGGDSTDTKSEATDTTVSEAADTTVSESTEPEETSAPEPVQPAAIKKLNEESLQRWHSPKFSVSGVFNSSMVLQRDKVITIWGFSDTDGSVVTGEFDGETATATVSEGEWAIGFAPRSASAEPKTMTIYDDRGNKVEFDDILIGDVWIITGQSNAELNLSACVAYYDQDITFDENAPIRLYHQDQAGAITSQAKLTIPQATPLALPNWGWQKPTRENSLMFSALGYYFAKTVSETIDVPIGMIAAYAGGACLRELMSLETVKERKLPEAGAAVPSGGYFNTQMYPFVGLQITGMIFFQGESEGTTRDLSERYDEDLIAHVNYLRSGFGFDFPFYNIQLCDYGSNPLWGYAGIVRVKQYEVSTKLENSYVIPSFDLAPEGSQDINHSPKKKALAERLAASVLAHEYNIGNASDVTAPVPLSYEESADKRTVTIKFANVGEGLFSINGDEKVLGFVYGRWVKQLDCEAVITAPDTIVVTIPDGAKRGDIFYAYPTHLIPGNNAQLTNSSGIPAPAFTIPLYSAKDN